MTSLKVDLSQTEKITKNNVKPLQKNSNIYYVVVKKERSSSSFVRAEDYLIRRFNCMIDFIARQMKIDYNKLMCCTSCFTLIGKFNIVLDKPKVNGEYKNKSKMNNGLRSREQIRIKYH